MNELLHFSIASGVEVNVNKEMANKCVRLHAACLNSHFITEFLTNIHFEHKYIIFAIYIYIQDPFSPP